MSEKETGGPAFPAGSIRKSRSAHDPGADFRITDMVQPANSGMTLRDYFAAKAMQELIANYGDMEGAAETAYEYADAMLKARSQ